MLTTKKLGLHVLAFIFFFFPRSTTAQQRPPEDPIVDMSNVIISAKKNRQGGADFYEGNTLMYKTTISFNDLRHWSLEKKRLVTLYGNKKIKSRGYYVVIVASSQTYLLPYGRHLDFWKNGRIKQVSIYDNHCAHIIDSLFDKNGKMEKMVRY